MTLYTENMTNAQANRIANVFKKLEAFKPKAFMGFDGNAYFKLNYNNVDVTFTVKQNGVLLDYNYFESGLVNVLEII